MEKHVGYIEDEIVEIEDVVFDDEEDNDFIDNSKYLENVEDILERITDKQDDPLFTEKQIFRLTSLSLNKEREIDFLTFQNKSLIYDLSGYWIEIDAQIDNEIKMLEILLEENKDSTLTSYDIFFELKLWDQAKEDYYKEMDVSRDQVQVKEGIVVCTNCKSRKTVSYEKQTRSADEGMTTIWKCLACGKQGRFNA